jgi:hypothetical protein
MRKAKKLKHSRLVLLWPESKVYVSSGDIIQNQRVPIAKVSCSTKVGNAAIYFEGEPIVLN